MQRIKAGVAVAAVLVVSGCMATTDGERAVIGAATGAVIASATDNDVATGAALGALAGVFCDDLNVPGCIRR